jgi:AraC-like DNA-binding protein
VLLPQRTPVDSNDAPLVAAPSIPLVARILELIETRLEDSAFGPAQAASLLGLSKSHLHRSLRTAGLSFVTTLNRRRVSRARVLLRESNLAIKEIAWRCGFSSTVQLDRWHRRIAGCAPTAFRMSSATPLAEYD